MTRDHWTDRLSEYVDDELDERTRSALEAHLARCGHCTSIVGDLRALSAEAAVLPTLPPTRDLWPEIQAELSPRASAAADTPAPRRHARASKGLAEEAAGTAPRELEGGSRSQRW